MFLFILLFMFLLLFLFFLLSFSFSFSFSLSFSLSLSLFLFFFLFLLLLLLFLFCSLFFSFSFFFSFAILEKSTGNSCCGLWTWDALDGRRRARSVAGGVRIRGLIETGNCGFIHFFCHARVVAMKTPSCKVCWHQGVELFRRQPWLAERCAVIFVIDFVRTTTGCHPCSMSFFE